MRTHPLLQHFNNRIEKSVAFQVEPLIDSTTTDVSTTGMINEAEVAIEPSVENPVIMDKHVVSNDVGRDLEQLNEVESSLLKQESSEIVGRHDADTQVTGDAEIDSFLRNIEVEGDNSFGYEGFDNRDNFWIDINGGFIAWKAVICLSLLDYKKLAEEYSKLINTLGMYFCLILSER